MPIEVLDHELQQMYELALDVAKTAGKMMKDANSLEKKVDKKDGSFADLVTETDKAIEVKVNTMIREKYPSHKFIGEETVAETGAKCDLTDDPTWIIDPIDGTSNFVHNTLEFAFSLGVTVNKQPVIGLVYVPMREEMYTARAGQGAFLNGKKIQTTDVTDLKNALVITEGGNSRDPDVLDTKMKNFHNIVKNCHGVRCYGSAAFDLCQVAAGRAEANYEYGIHIWDYVAGALIAREAGATVTDTTGEELNLLNRRILATSTPQLSKKISSLLTQLEMESD